jgi:predicted phage terminase large subunit-like protein
LILNPRATFLPNWHIKALAYHLELVRTGKLTRLIVNMPPRSLKSLVCSVAWPAFVLGNDPSKRIIGASYGADLAIKLGVDCRTIMQSAMFRGAFPRTRISQNTEAEITTTFHGGRLATSVGGSLTGRGGDLVIIDDPLKPQDALSDIKRERANDWFDNTLLSRLDDKRTGAIVVVAQRLRPNDLPGKLLQSSDEWTVLSLPAIAEREEWIKIGDDTYHFRKIDGLLHPEREPLEVLNQIRAQLGSDIFAAQYQQNPVAPGGNMIKRDWVRRYENLPARTSSTYILQSYDTASKDGEQNDWSVCTNWYVQEGKYYIADVLRGRFDYPTLKARAIAHAQLHRPTAILIEDTGVGSALAPELRNLGFTVIAVQVEHNKQTRMSIQSAKFEGGRVFFPNRASWLEDLETELFSFPTSRHDDQVDSVSQALAYEIKKLLWTDKSIEGFSNFVNGMAMDSYFGRLSGRPW